jgi:hypothetical protein
MTRWRTGTKNPHNIYLDDKPVGFILDEELAKLVVERLECFPTVGVFHAYPEHLVETGQPRCKQHDAALANRAFFKCGCRHIAAPPNVCRHEGFSHTPNVACPAAGAPSEAEKVSALCPVCGCFPCLRTHG